MLGKTERRLTLVISLTAILPLAVAVFLAQGQVNVASAGLTRPDIGVQLERGVDVYKEYVARVRADMEHQADAMAADERLRAAARRRDLAAAQARLDQLFPLYPELFSLELTDLQGKVAATRLRAEPIHEGRERPLRLTRGLTTDAAPVVVVASFALPPGQQAEREADALLASASLRAAAIEGDASRREGLLDAAFAAAPHLESFALQDAEGHRLAARDRPEPLEGSGEAKAEVRRALGSDVSPLLLAATFAFDNRFEADLKQAGDVKQTYKTLVDGHEELVRQGKLFFTGLLVATAMVTIVLGILFARGVTKRINRLANAIEVVAKGNLSVRVPVTGSDELTELARVFNRMLGEMQQSRARIEYLQRMGAWQEMAKRLAHEIKNPLTPIQLAVQECHRKYGGEDGKFRALLDTTLEIVEEEVGTLRRLVGDFSNFARMPQVTLEEADVVEFVRECAGTLAHAGDGEADSQDSGAVSMFQSATDSDVTIAFDLPRAALTAAIDRQMLRRVLFNLVRNAKQAIRESRGEGSRGRVRVSVRAEGEGTAIEVEDDGPGVPEDARERVFDPYFTTKADGTGLGLAIVKKIVVEHGGSIEAAPSAKLGGARFVVRLPAPRSLEALAAEARGPVSARA